MIPGRKSIFYLILLLLTCFTNSLQAQQDTLRQYVDGLYEQVLKDERLTSQLKESDMANLPIGIVKEIGGKQYIIAVDQMRSTLQGNFFDAYLRLELPMSKEPIVFKALNIAFHKGGLSTSSTMKLVLASQHEGEVNKDIKLILPADGRNYVEWDCNGFRSLTLKGIFEFSEKVFIPDNPNQDKVTGTFEAQTGDPGSIITALSISPFQLKPLKGFSFEVQEAVMDYSDIANPTSILFPEGYEQHPDLALLWQGVYLRRFSVTLPEEIMTKNGRARLEAENMIIDRAGVSGIFSADGLFTTESGTLDGWPFSIHGLEVALVKSQLAGAGFRGQVQLPLFDESMNYEALIYNENNETNYAFSVQTGRSFKAPILGADIELDPSSFIKITKVNGRFRPEAILNGHASIQSGSVDFKQLKFEQLHLATVKPYVRSGVWSLVGEGNQQEVATFPVSIQNLVVQHDANALKLSADVALSLMDSDDKGFGVKTRVSVHGEIEEKMITVGEETVTEQKWVYAGTNVDDINLKVSADAFTLDGTIRIFEKDNTYGSGFRGDILASFAGGPALEATAQFGKVDGYRYWYADAKAIFPQGAGFPLGVWGFGGGMYYHMALQKFDQVDLSDAQTTGSQNLQVGQSRSGIVFMPDESVGLGLRATVILGTTPDPYAFNADATMEMAFNSSGGLRYAGYSGEAFFLAGFEDRSRQAPIYAELLMLYDFDNETYHATMDSYVNVENVIKGIHANDRAGQAVIHFSPDEWYVHVGTPDQPIGVEFYGLTRSNTYIMAGTHVPAMPTPPSNVSEILDDMEVDLMRDEHALSTGTGFAFGTSLQVGTGRLQYLMFYGEFNTELGFDLMLKNYGSTQCAGRSGPIGINGWYASGQAYSYLKGVIGIKVDMKFIEGNFDILNIGAAAVLQAKLPNPVYMQGMVGGEFSLLGGLVSGTCKFKVTIGEACEISGASELTGVKVISDLSPAEGEGEMSVFTTPQAAFAMSMDRPYELLDEDNEFKAYRVKLDYFKVTHNGAEVPGELRWNESNDVVLFKSFQVLPPKAELTAEVKILWEEQVNGVWKPLGGSGSQEYELETRKFRTSEAPKNIPEENVRYTYPLKGQYNYHKEEHGSNYITLGSGQGYLFEPTDDAGLAWNYLARFYSLGAGHVVDAPVSYAEFSNRAGGEVSWTAPKDLLPETVYELKVIKLPAEDKAVDSNVTKANTNVYQSDTDSTVVAVAQSTLAGTLALADEFVLYDTYFRTSKYSTFSEKLTAVPSEKSTAVFIDGHNLVKLGYRLDSDELFGEVELSGWKEAQPLIQLEAFTDNPWYRDHIYPNLYQHYPPDHDIRIDAWSRSDREEGIPPLRALNIYQPGGNRRLDPSALVEPSLAGRIYINYDLEAYTNFDYFELQKKAINKYLDSSLPQPEGIKKLLKYDFTNLLSFQKYGFKLMYVLPGGGMSEPKTYYIDF